MIPLATMLLILFGAPAAAEVRLYVFDCGSLQLEDVTAFGLENDETPVRELFVPCYLLEHRGDEVRRLLFDAGLPAGLAGQGDVELERGTTVRYQRALENQLAALDLTPADIDYVAFSHLHFDHVGSADLFTGSTQLIQAPEYHAGFVEKREIYEPNLYLGLTESSRRLLEGDHDVFGESRALRRTPVFNTDAQQTLESMDKIDALLEREGAVLWIEHDRALAETLRKAPQFYR